MNVFQSVLALSTFYLTMLNFLNQVAAKFDFQGIACTFDIISVSVFTLFVIKIDLDSKNLMHVVTLGFGCIIFAQLLSVEQMPMFVQALMCIFSMAGFAFFVFTSDQYLKNMLQTKLSDEELRASQHIWDHYITGTVRQLGQVLGYVLYLIQHRSETMIVVQFLQVMSYLCFLCALLNQDAVE